MKYNSNIECILVTKTRELLAKRPRDLPYRIIAEETGLDHSWISKLVMGTAKEPSVGKVWCLYEYLSGSKITLP